MGWKDQSLSDLMRHAMFGNRVEPKKRMFQGRYGYAIHRFPIKGGISMGVVLAENVSQNNAILKRLRETNG